MYKNQAIGMTSCYGTHCGSQAARSGPLGTSQPTMAPSPPLSLAHLGGQLDPTHARIRALGL